LRYFDPTQALCRNRIDKGLTEALMLKRAKCTIYLAQESDTMGKDSELAATLAQGKPVIAYVPQIEVEKRAAELAAFPLQFFKQRILALRAEGLFEAPEVIPDLEACDPGFNQTLSGFETALQRHLETYPLTLVDGQEDQFKLATRSLTTAVCRLRAVAEKHSFERRAALLQQRHPLGIQVNLVLRQA
jgi:hypothetical protein